MSDHGFASLVGAQGAIARRMPTGPIARSVRSASLVMLVLIALVFAIAGSTGCVRSGVARREPFDPHSSSPAQRARIDALRARLAPVVASLKDPEALLLLELDTLYRSLDADERALLDEIRFQPGAEPTVSIPSDVDWVRVEGQVARTATGDRTIPLQLLSEPAWRAFGELDRAMRQALGRGLLIGSAYRSPAYQLQLIVQLLPRFDYSLEQTVVHVSLPGASDHNRVDRLGVDFVSEQGIDLAYGDPAAFMALPEYAWLVANAARFGFEPDAVRPGEPVASPWHWRFSGRP
jgi:hypothetical protein